MLKITGVDYTASMKKAFRMNLSKEETRKGAQEQLSKMLSEYMKQHGIKGRIILS